MSIKKFLLKKKLQQGNTLIDSLFIEKVIDKIEALVLEEQIEKKQILQKTADDLVKELQDFTGNLEEGARNDLKTRLANSLSEITEKKDDLIGHFTDSLTDYQKIVASRINEFENTTAKVLKEIEKKRGDKGDKGDSGNDGRDGKDGKDGSPDTATDIAAKLNKETEIIDPSVIKGLLKTIEDLKRTLRQKEKGGGGGGGMGAVQHETKNVSSATTTIATDYKIAGNGYAIMGAYYQSALIMRGEHYSVGGDKKTLTLLFTPQDNTKIDIIYVRG